MTDDSDAVPSMNGRYDTGGISPEDAVARFGGVVLLVLVGYAHLLDLSHKIDEGIWYMAFGFIGLIAAAICIAVALVRASDTTVRTAWVGASLICLGALFGYAVSRLIPLPGMADHQGDWINTYGVLALLSESALIGLAAYAMRDLTLRDVPYAPPQWLRPPAPRTWPAAAIALASLHALPAQALAHGGEDDEEPTGGAVAGGVSSGGESKAMTGENMDGHGDPFLGTVELTLAFLVSVGFIAWAASQLYGRVEVDPVHS